MTLLAGLVALLLAAPQPAGQLYDLRSGELAYDVVHPMHHVHGVTHAMEGRALVKPSGEALVQVRAKVASFDSGNSNRDAHMREVTHEPVHPYVSVKGTIDHLATPLTAAVDTTLHAHVSLNGVDQAIDVPVHLAPEGNGIRATFKFPISLDAFHVERPALLFVKVEDKAQISGNLLFGAEK